MNAEEVTVTIRPVSEAEIKRFWRNQEIAEAVLRRRADEHGIRLISGKARPKEGTVVTRSER